MQSHFVALKDKAIRLRKQGESIGEIERLLGVPRSTLSGWFKNITLTQDQLFELRKRWILGLVKARERAALYHRSKKQERLDKALRDANSILAQLNSEDKNVLKLSLAMLFVGEGFKSAEETSLGNSNPKIVKAYLMLINKTYGLNKKRLKLYLHLRADQHFERELKFWSDFLNLEPACFGKTPQRDKRTIGKKTFADYHGVCVVRYYDVSIKRELLALSESFFGRF